MRMKLRSRSNVHRSSKRRALLSTQGVNWLFGKKAADSSRKKKKKNHLRGKHYNATTREME